MSLKEDYIKITKFYALHAAVGVAGLGVSTLLYGFPGMTLLHDPLHVLHVAYDPLLMLPDTSGLFPLEPWLFVSMLLTYLAFTLLAYVSTTALIFIIVVLPYAFAIFAPVIQLLTPNRYEGGRGP